MNKRFLEKYEKTKEIYEKREREIELVLIPWITEFCKYKDWMNRTSNRPSVTSFEIYGSKIKCNCSIYVGCGEVDDFEMDVPMEYILANEEERNRIIDSKKQLIDLAKKAEQTKKLQEERNIKLKEIEKLNKELGEIS